LTYIVRSNRATLAVKCDGLADDQLRERAVPPSSSDLCVDLVGLRSGLVASARMTAAIRCRTGSGWLPSLPTARQGGGDVHRRMGIHGEERPEGREVGEDVSRH
jgi:Protein of unknown function (DUF664)